MATAFADLGRRGHRPAVPDARGAPARPSRTTCTPSASRWPQATKTLVPANFAELKKQGRTTSSAPLVGGAPVPRQDHNSCTTPASKAFTARHSDRASAKDAGTHPARRRPLSGCTPCPPLRMNTPPPKRLVQARLRAIATLIMDGLLDYRHAAALMGSADPLRCHGVRYTIAYEIRQQPDRPTLATGWWRGFAEDWDDSLFIDADIAWQPGVVVAPAGGRALQPRPIRASPPRRALPSSPAPPSPASVSCSWPVVLTARLRRDRPVTYCRGAPELRLRDSNDPPNPTTWRQVRHRRASRATYVGEDFLSATAGARSAARPVDATSPCSNIGNLGGKGGWLISCSPTAGRRHEPRTRRTR